MSDAHAIVYAQEFSPHVFMCVMKNTQLKAFISTPGSCEMGCHK